MSFISTPDGTQIYYKNWGARQPVIFSHGWPLTADSWESQMMFLAGAVIAVSRTIGGDMSDRHGT